MSRDDYSLWHDHWRNDSIREASSWHTLRWSIFNSFILKSIVNNDDNMFQVTFNHGKAMPTSIQLERCNFLTFTAVQNHSKMSKLRKQLTKALQQHSRIFSGTQNFIDGDHNINAYTISNRQQVSLHMPCNCTCQSLSVQHNNPYTTQHQHTYPHHSSHTMQQCDWHLKYMGINWYQHEVSAHSLCFCRTRIGLQ